MADRKKVSSKALNRAALRGAKVKRRASAVPTPEEVAAVEPRPAPPPAPDNSIPFAAMQASQNAINSQLAAIVENNTMAIEQFRLDLANEKPKAGVAYRHHVKRDRNKLIEYVDSFPLTSR